MKRIVVASVLIFVMAITVVQICLPTASLSSTNSESNIMVTLDGRNLTFDVPPRIVNDRVLVPLRFIFEVMGASVSWDGSSQTVTATKDDMVVVMPIGSNTPTINGEVVHLDQPGIIVDDRTLAPLRFVAEAFGGTVEWDSAERTASITSQYEAEYSQTAPSTAFVDFSNKANWGIAFVYLQMMGKPVEEIAGNYLDWEFLDGAGRLVFYRNPDYNVGFAFTATKELSEYYDSLLSGDEICIGLIGDIGYLFTGAVWPQSINETNEYLSDFLGFDFEMTLDDSDGGYWFRAEVEPNNLFIDIYSETGLITNDTLILLARHN